MGWKKFKGQDIKVNDIVTLNTKEKAIAVSHTYGKASVDGLDSLFPSNWTCDFLVDKAINDKSGLRKDGWIYNVYGIRLFRITHVFTIPKLKGED